MEEEVNIINSEVLLKERGIEIVEETVSDKGAFSSSIRTEVVTENETYVASGTLFGKNMPRLIRLNDYRLEAYLDGTLFVFKHRDVPGIIGTVGTIFGAHNVNIAQMAVGRTTNEPGGVAIGVLNLDSTPGEAAMERVNSSQDVVAASIVELPTAGQMPSWLS
jgi:D-3-phosphoglycerate dehydrogenase